MVEIAKFISKDIGDLDKILGVDKANLSKISGIDVPSAGPSWHSFYTWNTYWEAGNVNCWDPTIPSIGAYSGCTGNYIEVKGTWAGGLRPTKFRIIHDGPDDAPNGLRNITLYESDWSVLGIYNTAAGYNSGAEIDISWGTEDLFRLKIESYENGDGWNSIAITDIQFYF